MLTNDHRLLALELGKPLMIDDNACDTEYPEPVDDQYITHQGISQEASSTSLLATIHVVRSVQPILKLFKSPCLTNETLQSCEKHLDACMSLLPPPLLLSSTELLDPRSITPMINLQNIRIILHRHNLSPFCAPEARYRAVNMCVNVALGTSRLISRCFGSPATSISRRDFALSATTLLCTHVWRCTLFLIFRGEYEAASVLVHALSTIDMARTVTVDCGRNISFFLRCVVERLQSGIVGDFERDEEMMAYVSGDVQSSAENSWIWQGSETGANLISMLDDQGSSPAVKSDWPLFARANPEKSLYDRVSTEEPPQDWDGWELIERSLHYLWEQQQQQQRGNFTHQSFGLSPGLRPGGPQRLADPLPSLRLQPLQQQQLSQPPQQSQQQAATPGTSRMTIASII